MARTIASQIAGTVPRDLQAIVADAGTFMLANNNEGEHLDEMRCDFQHNSEENEKQQDNEIRRQLDETVDKCNQTMQVSMGPSVAHVERAFERFKSRMASELGAPKV